MEPAGLPPMRRQGPKDLALQFTGPNVPFRRVHHMLHKLRERGLCSLRNCRTQRSALVCRDHVRRQQHPIAELQDSCVAGQRLLRQNVERRSGERARLKRIAERVEVDDGAASGVDEHGRRFQQRQPAPVEQPARLGREVAVQRDDVGLAQQCFGSARSTP